MPSRKQYRVRSNRARNWDYASNAAYFVTICTRNKKCYFGNVYFDHTTFQISGDQTLPLPMANGPRVSLTELGKYAFEEWGKSSICRPDMNISLGEFIIMPNHVHGIIMIGTNPYNSNFIPDKVTRKFGPQRKNLSSVNRGYKSSVTTHAKRLGIEFEWQRSYYDHIIRGEADFDRITQYIRNNPKEWYKDRLYVR